MIIILCRFIPEGPNSVRVTFSHFRNLISESSELGTDLNSQMMERKPRKRLGVGILFFWGAYPLRSLLGLA
jgi:hypothetical protein